MGDMERFFLVCILIFRTGIAKGIVSCHIYVIHFYALDWLYLFFS